MDVQRFRKCFIFPECIYCSSSLVSLWYVVTWIAQTGCSPPHTHTPKPYPQQITFLHLDLHSIAAQHSACWHVLHDVHCSSWFSVVFFPWLQLAAFGKQERRWKRAIVGKCSFLSGMTQAAAVISTVIVGHHQRASITPARPWHRQQVPALPARLAPTWLWKPSDIQKGTDLHWMHHWINTADYQLTYTVLYHTEKRGKMGFETQKACLKILAVCCYNHMLNTDLALFKVGFTSLCGFVLEIQYEVHCACSYTSVIVQVRLCACWLHL